MLCSSFKFGGRDRIEVLNEISLVLLIFKTEDGCLHLADDRDIKAEILAHVPLQVLLAIAIGTAVVLKQRILEAIAFKPYHKCRLWKLYTYQGASDKDFITELV